MLVERRDAATIKDESRQAKPNIARGSKGKLQPKGHQTGKGIGWYIGRRGVQARRTGKRGDTATARARAGEEEPAPFRFI
jgi:hypothetical protein